MKILIIYGIAMQTTHKEQLTTENQKKLFDLNLKTRHRKRKSTDTHVFINNKSYLLHILMVV